MDGLLLKAIGQLSEAHRTKLERVYLHYAPGVDVASTRERWIAGLQQRRRHLHSLLLGNQWRERSDVADFLIGAARAEDLFPEREEGPYACLCRGLMLAELEPVLLSLNKLLSEYARTGPRP